MSKTHIVTKTDNLELLSLKYYGVRNKIYLIVDANPQIQGRSKTVSGNPVIHTGESLIIPDEIEEVTNPTQVKEPPESIKNASKDSISILIDDNLFSFFTDYSITFDIDLFDTFSFSAPFDDSLKIYRDSFRPFSYKPVAIYYGSELILTGTLLAPETQLTPNIKELLISGYSKPGILNDCMMPISSYPKEFNNQKLDKITPVLCKPYGIQYSFLSSSGNPFEKVSLEIEKNILTFLTDLAKQRGLLITNDEKGKLIFWKSSTSQPVASFKEGELTLISCKPSFNYQLFYSHITGVTSTTESKSSAKYTYENKYLISRGILRNYNCIIEDVKDSEIKQAVMVKAGRMFGESTSYDLTVYGHRDRNGNLFRKNTIISLYSPGAMIYTETEFLIKSLTMSRGVDGDTTDFELVLPGAYTGEIPEVFPWEE